jgi:ferrous iron transport protein B
MVDIEQSILASIGHVIAPLFAPLGWGDWKASVASITGLIAKENVVGTFGILYGFAEVAEDGAQVWGSLQAAFTPLSAYTFLIFNLLCAPCFAAIGAVRNEMASAKWTWATIGYQTGFAYVIALIVYQLGTLFTGGSFGIGTIVAIALVCVFIYLLFRKPVKINNKVSESEKEKVVV